MTTSTKVTDLYKPPHKIITSELCREGTSQSGTILLVGKCCWRYHFGWEGFRHIFAWLRDLIMELRPLLERITAMIRGMDRILEKLSIIADYAYHGGTEMQNSVIHNFIKQYTNWKEKLHTIHYRTQMSYYNHRFFVIIIE